MAIHSKLYGIQQFSAVIQHSPHDLQTVEFARKSSQNCDTKSMFPLKVKSKSKLNNEAYKVNFASTERLKKSAIPYMQRLLNKNSQSKEKDKT